MKKIAVPKFDASQFTGTKFNTAEDKAKFLTKLCRFLINGCQWSQFNNPLYNGLNLHFFGHIAHYNRGGFYDEWFSSTVRRLEWIDRAINRRVYGDPAWTWSDAEAVLQQWLRDSGIREYYAPLADTEAQIAAVKLATATMQSLPDRVRKTVIGLFS